MLVVLDCVGGRDLGCLSYFLKQFLFSHNTLVDWLGGGQLGGIEFG